MLLESVQDAFTCRDLNQFEIIIGKIKSHLCFDHAFCTALNKKEMVPLRVIELDYPQEYLHRYFGNSYYLRDPVASELLSTFEIQHWQDVDKKYGSLKNRDPSTVEAIEFGLKDGVTYGTIDADQTIATCFSFAGATVECNFRSTTIIKYITPHLAEALKRILYQEKNGSPHLLSSREKEVINWIKEGKTSWEISSILAVQERTINFHLTNIKKKLNASTRSQAVAMAIARGEIHM